MLSEKKTVLRLAELAAIAATLVALTLAYSTWRTPNPDFPVFPWATTGMAAMMLTFLPACMLGGEYVKTVKRPTTWRGRTEGLNSKDISFVFRWAPSAYRVAAIAAVLLMVATALKYGSISFHSDQQIEVQKLPGMFLYMSVFYLLALPVLGSASRMPGSYVSASNA